MMILWREKLAFLAVPKTGTTAIETVLAPHAAIAYMRPPMVKHMTLSRFNRFMRPYLEIAGLGDVQTFAVMREPVSWLGSWYRYRQRDGLVGSSKSTAGISFDDFVRAYLMDDNRPDYAEVGAQARFLKPGKGPGISHLFRYDALSPLVTFLSEQLGQPVDLPQVNVSPSQSLSLSSEIEAALRQKYAADFTLYESLKG
jgi:hypothetical protein